MAMNLKMTGVAGFVEPRELDCMAAMMNAANEALLSRNGAGSDFLAGWICR